MIQDKERFLLDQQHLTFLGRKLTMAAHFLNTPFKRIQLILHFVLCHLDGMQIFVMALDYKIITL